MNGLQARGSWKVSSWRVSLWSLSLVKKEEELLEGAEEGPLREDADALVAEDLALRLGAVLAQVEPLPLLLRQPLLGVLLVEGDGRAVDLGPVFRKALFSPSVLYPCNFTGLIYTFCKCLSESKSYSLNTNLCKCHSH